MKSQLKQAVSTAAILTMTVMTSALAQDVIGAQPVANATIVVFKVIAGIGVGWGFLRLMSGRHTLDGLVMMGVGALGLAKTQLIIGLLGLGG